MKRNHPARIDRKSAWLLIALFGAVLLLWGTPAVYPIQLFVVLLHELSDGLAAIATGGSIVRIELSQAIGGSCWSVGGSRLLVLAAGYLGSMFWGGAILVGAARSRQDRMISMGIGLFIGVATLLYVRNAFGVAFGLGFAGAMVAAGRWLSPALNDGMLKMLGLCSCLYAVIDIKEDLIVRTVAGSDAYAMADLVHLPPVVVGVLWLGIALAAGAVFLRMALTSPAPFDAGELRDGKKMSLDRQPSD